MDPANNSPTNNNPISGATPGTPPAVNPLQPTSVPSTPPVAGTPSAPADVPPTPAAASGVSQMPSMTETLNMVAAEGAAQTAGTSPTPTAGATSSANTVVGGGVTAATPVPVEPTAPPATADPMVGAAKDEVVDALSVANDEPKSAPGVPPIARPTNIDGINSARMPKMPVGSMPSRAAAPVGPNPFANTADKQTPSVSFTDPMTEPEPNTSEPVATPVTASKKKSSKTTLIILSVIAFIVAVALAVVLVMELMGVGPFATNNNSEQTSSQSQDSGSTNSSSSNSESGSSGYNDVNNDTEVNPGEDTIVCTATEEGTTEDGNSYNSAVTMTLYFTDDSFSRVSVRTETIFENNTTPFISTMDMTAVEMLEASSFDWDEVGVKPNADGSVAATRDQVMQGINASANSTMTCINPNSM